MNERQSKLLVAIIDQFIATALPVGSKSLLASGDFSCSSATIRNQMVLLEDEGFLEQLHISSGRVPTAKGYRAYVKDCMEPSVQEKAVLRRFNSLREQYFQRKDQERAYEAVALLAHMSPNVAFATVPHKDRVYYLGLSNVLKQPEFQANPALASDVAELLEEKLDTLLDQVDVDDKVRYYIGDDHILKNIPSCSIMVTEYAVRDFRGAIGILGPMRMDYAYNTVALDIVVDLLCSYESRG
ncbi:MAG: hypothetical protein WCX61_02190 [Candidatus Peribacteraceae bacterium]|jgi:heat-inducible transcriptional repressor